MQHHFDVDVACKYGILESVLINHLQYWIQHNEANEINFYDGRYWTYNSIKAFSAIFPYASENKIRNALKHLQDENIILIGNYNKSSYDRTLWYAFTDFGISIFQNYKMEFSEHQNGFSEIEEPIPDNIPNIEPNIEPNGFVEVKTLCTKLSATKPVKHKYGQYKNVLLSDVELEKLKQEFPDTWEEKIERLSEYIESKGVSYKSHLATIRRRARKAGEQAQQRPDQKPKFTPEHIQQAKEMGITPEELLELKKRLRE